MLSPHAAAPSVNTDNNTETYVDQVEHLLISNAFRRPQPVLDSTSN